MDTREKNVDKRARVDKKLRIGTRNDQDRGRKLTRKKYDNKLTDYFLFGK
jgi:hypothetical protein